MRMYDLAGADDAYRFSPYCWRIRMACAHKGVPLETIAWRFSEKDLLPQPNNGLVPVLVDENDVISDSWKIAEYLEVKAPGPRLFDSQQAKAQALLIKYWAERSLHPFITRMTVLDTWAGLHEKDKAYFRESREKRLGKRLEEIVSNREESRVQFRQTIDPLRASLMDQLFVCGNSPAFSDYVLFGTFMWARCVSNFELLEATDPVWAWRERMLKLFGELGARAVRNPAVDQSSG